MHGFLAGPEMQKLPRFGINHQDAKRRERHRRYKQREGYANWTTGQVIVRKRERRIRASKQGRH